MIIDLVVNHTSDQHPWFQSARSDAGLAVPRLVRLVPTTEPADRKQGMVFPGEQDETWSYDRTAKAWYYHRFYKFQPDLNIGQPRPSARRSRRSSAFWLQLGVAGFRIDAVPFIIELTEPGNPDSAQGLRVPHRAAPARAVAARPTPSCSPRPTWSPTQLVEYFGDAGGSDNRIHMLFDFMLNGRLMLALARQRPGAASSTRCATPRRCRPAGSGPRSCATTTRSTCPG